MADPIADTPSDMEVPPISADIVAFQERMFSCCATLAAIGTPEALAASQAVCDALDGMSAALQQAFAAMAAVTPTTH